MGPVRRNSNGTVFHCSLPDDEEKNSLTLVGLKNGEKYAGACVTTKTHTEKPCGSQQDAIENVLEQGDD